MTTSWTRREMMRRSARMALALGVGGPILQACGGDSDADSSSSGVDLDPLIGRPDQPVELPVAEGNAPIADGLAPEAGPLRIFNYADYVSPDTVDAFSKAYGVDVEITTFDTDAEAVTKLASGQVNVDLQLSMGYNSLHRVVAGGLAQPLNRSYITNFSNLLAPYQDPFYDSGSQYTVPYTVFSTGIGYRTDRIDPTDMNAAGWDALWDPTYKGEASVIDDVREGLAMPMLRSGLTDVNTGDADVITQAGDDLSELTDLVNIKVNIEGYKDVPEGATTIAHCWSGDMLTGAANYLPEGTGPEVLGFWYPDDNQGIVNNDCMFVVKGAEHPVLAHLFINWLLDPVNAEQNFAWNGYQQPLAGLGADELIDKGLVPENLRNCVLTDEVIESGYRLLALTPETETIWEDTWSAFSTGA